MNYKTKEITQITKLGNDSQDARNKNIRAKINADTLFMLSPPLFDIEFIFCPPPDATSETPPVKINVFAISVYII